MSSFRLVAVAGQVLDWWITSTAARISDLRRQGITDSQIVTVLQGPDHGTNILGGPTNVTIAASFDYLSTGKFPPGTACLTQACTDQAGGASRVPIEASYSGPLKWGNVILWGGVAAGAAWFLFLRK